ncbi:MAG: hypothetical protein ONB51_07120 [candidate division KSB1 bacterium]|nr:hypothetical protein [candidate division KSB1 bacterium]
MPSFIGLTFQFKKNPGWQAHHFKQGSSWASCICNSFWYNLRRAGQCGSRQQSAGRHMESVAILRNPLVNRARVVFKHNFVGRSTSTREASHAILFVLLARLAVQKIFAIVMVFPGQY